MVVAVCGSRKISSIRWVLPDSFEKCLCWNLLASASDLASLGWLWQSLLWLLDAFPDRLISNQMFGLLRWCVQTCDRLEIIEIESCKESIKIDRFLGKYPDRTFNYWKCLRSGRPLVDKHRIDEFSGWQYQDFSTMSTKKLKDHLNDVFVVSCAYAGIVRCYFGRMSELRDTSVVICLVNSFSR